MSLQEGGNISSLPENEDALYDLLCSELASQADETTDDFGGIKRRIDAFIRCNVIFEHMSTLEKVSLSQNWYNRITGYDFLEAFLKDPEVTEIMVNGPSNLFIERQNKMERIRGAVTEERLRQLIQKMVSDVDRRVNYRDPIVDARLRDGARLNVVTQPIGLEGPYLTIRKFRKDLLTLEALRDRGMMDNQVLDFLKGAVRARQNLMISGGTSSGKTTLLNCLSRCIPRGERVISLEDSAELNLNDIENLVRLETRPPTAGDELEITMSDLIRTALRMRPDRMVVGEIRGAEALDMLQALNTGHDGSMSTGHSNSAGDMLDRIEAMALMAGYGTAEGIRRQIGSGIHLIIHLKKDGNGSRKIQEIVKVLGCRDNRIEYKTVIAERGLIVDDEIFKSLTDYA